MLSNVWQIFISNDENLKWCSPEGNILPCGMDGSLFKMVDSRNILRGLSAEESLLPLREIQMVYDKSYDNRIVRIG